jgi:hypothetical protein
MSYDHWKTTEPDFGDEPLPLLTKEEEETEAWEYWHERALHAEGLVAELQGALHAYADLSWPISDVGNTLRILREDARTVLSKVPAPQSTVTKMREALEQCAEYFDNRADITNEHDEDGSPRPNEEMRLLTEIREALA